MNKHIRKLEAARRLGTKVSDLERARESERSEELRAQAPKASKDIGYGGHPYGAAEERAAMIADGCHPDSFGSDGADRDL